MKINEFIAILDFLGDDMTEAQAVELIDKAKQELSIAEIQELYEMSTTYSIHFYSELSQYDGEIGGLNRY